MRVSPRLGVSHARLHRPDNRSMDDHAIRIAVLLAGHVIFLSAAALRIIRGQRGHLIRTEAPWWIQYYPPVVWIPFVLVYAQVAWLPSLVPALDLASSFQVAGLILSIASALLAAWGMWTPGPTYGIRPDLFEGHAPKTARAFGPLRHP